MIDLNLILPEIFISLILMLLLIIEVFKKNSSILIYNLPILSVFVLLALVLNLYHIEEAFIFNQSYVIDDFSNFMKILTAISAIFVMSISSDFLKSLNIYKIEYPILILCSILGMMVMIG